MILACLTAVCMAITTGIGAADKVLSCKRMWENGLRAYKRAKRDIPALRMCTHKIARVLFYWAHISHDPYDVQEFEFLQVLYNDSIQALAQKELGQQIFAKLAPMWQQHKDCCYPASGSFKKFCALLESWLSNTAVDDLVSDLNRVVESGFVQSTLHKLAADTTLDFSLQLIVSKEVSRQVNEYIKSEVDNHVEPGSHSHVDVFQEVQSGAASEIQTLPSAESALKVLKLLRPESAKVLLHKCFGAFKQVAQEQKRQRHAQSWLVRSIQLPKPTSLDWFKQSNISLQDQSLSHWAGATCPVSGMLLCLSGPQV